MQQITVSDLASEFEMRNAVVISELKKVGVWVPSSDTPVDHDIADRIRRRLQLMERRRRLPLRSPARASSSWGNPAKELKRLKRKRSQALG